MKKMAIQPPVIELAENPDILASVTALPSPPFCIGFAAESHQVLEFARAKRAQKRTDAGGQPSLRFHGQANQSNYHY